MFMTDGTEDILGQMKEEQVLNKRRSFTLSRVWK